MDDEDDYEECVFCGLEHHWDELSDGMCPDCIEEHDR